MFQGQIDLKAFNAVRYELHCARVKHPDFPSRHHALAIIREEYLELEREIFEQRFDDTKIAKEAIQLAATCIRLLTEIRDSQGEPI